MCIILFIMSETVFSFFFFVGKTLFSLLLSEEHVDIWETDKFVCIPPLSSPPVIFPYVRDQACTEEIQKLLA